MRCILLMVVGAAVAVGFVLGNDTFDTADYLGELSCGGGRLTANDYDIDPIGDVDFVKFYVPCSMTVTIETTGPSGGDTVIRLYDQYRNLIEEDDDDGTGYYSYISRTLSEGYYYVRVHEYGSDDTLYDYDIIIRGGRGCSDNDCPEGADYLGDLPRSGGTLVANDYDINPVGDVDYVKFYVPCRMEVEIETSGPSGGDTVIELYDEDLVLIERDDDGGTGYYSYISQTLSEGYYYVRVNEYGNDDTLYNYDLEIRGAGCGQPSESEVEPNNGPLLADAIGTLPGTLRIRASIEPAGDIDWFSFDVSGRRSVTIETSGPSGDTIIILYDEDLDVLAFDDDSGSGNFSRIQITLGSGTYFVAVLEYGDPETIYEYYLTVR